MALDFKSMSETEVKATLAKLNTKKANLQGMNQSVEAQLLDHGYDISKIPAQELFETVKKESQEASAQLDAVILELEPHMATIEILLSEN